MPSIVQSNPGEGVLFFDGPYALTPALSPREREPTSGDDSIELNLITL